MAPDTLTRDDDGRTIALTIGETLHIVLAENPTTGYRWVVEVSDAGVLAIRSDHFPLGSGAAGAGGMRRVELVAVGKGDATVSARLRRPWEGTQAAIDRFAITITVASGETGDHPSR